MKKPEDRKPGTIHQLGIKLPEFLAGHTIGLIAYGKSPVSRQLRALVQIW